MIKNIIKLSPHFSFTVWGGTELSQKKGLDLPPEKKLGESWEISTLPQGPSQTSAGPLNQLFDVEQLPYLVKFIDTAQALSVQVHPDDQAAKDVGADKGKDECWLILGAQANAGIYLGLKPSVDRSRLESALKSGEDLSLLLNYYPVKPGDFFYVPAGTVHALGPGLLLLEVQQSCGITYRL
ncbi:MAG: type I phosphomannose isomerase catalytic subunit, partial [Pseudomonadota bacterium]